MIRDPKNTQLAFCHHSLRSPFTDKHVFLPKLRTTNNWRSGFPSALRSQQTSQIHSSDTETLKMRFSIWLFVPHMSTWIFPYEALRTPNTAVTSLKAVNVIMACLGKKNEPWKKTHNADLNNDLKQTPSHWNLFPEPQQRKWIKVARVFMAVGKTETAARKRSLDFYDCVSMRIK